MFPDRPKKSQKMKSPGQPKAVPKAEKLHVAKYSRGVAVNTKVGEQMFQRVNVSRERGRGRDEKWSRCGIGRSVRR